VYLLNDVSHVHICQRRDQDVSTRAMRLYDQRVHSEFSSTSSERQLLVMAHSTSTHTQLCNETVPIYMMTACAMTSVMQCDETAS